MLIWNVWALLSAKKSTESQGPHRGPGVCVVCMCCVTLPIDCNRKTSFYYWYCCDVGWSPKQTWIWSIFSPELWQMCDTETTARKRFRGLPFHHALQHDERAIFAENNKRAVRYIDIWKQFPSNYSTFFELLSESLCLLAYLKIWCKIKSSTVRKCTIKPD